jgi:hypothetical protein
MVTFQWDLFDAIGHRPVVERDIRSGGPLPPDATVLHFSVRDGGFSVLPGPGDLRVRRQTATALNAVAQGEEPSALDPDDCRRCARLLAAWARGLIGDETAALAWLYPDLPRH